MKRATTIEMIRFQLKVDVIISAFARKFWRKRQDLNLQEYFKTRLFSKQLWLPFHHVSEREILQRDKIEATLAGFEPADTNY